MQPVRAAQQHPRWEQQAGCKPELLPQCQACPVGWELCTQHRGSRAPQGLWHSSPVGKAEERPRKLSLVLDLLALPRLQPQHHQGLQIAVGEQPSKLGGHGQITPQKQSAVVLTPRGPGPGIEDRVMQKEMLLNCSTLSIPSLELLDVIQAVCQG